MSWDKRAERDVRTNATIRRVRQIGATDCGVAAVAMIANTSYSEAHAAVGRKKRQRRGTTFEECWNALEVLGVNIERKRRSFRSWSKIPSDALVLIQWRDNRALHWLVFQKHDDGENRLLDPAAEGNTLTLVHRSRVIGKYFSLVSAKRRPPRPSATDDHAPPASVAPAPRAGSSSDHLSHLGNMSVTAARDSPDARLAIRQLTALSARKVASVLRRTHGRTLVRNAFADSWPDGWGRRAQSDR